MNSHTDGYIDQQRERDRHASGDLQAIGRVDVQAGDLLWRFSICPQQLDNQLCLVARRDPNHPVLHPEADIKKRSLEYCVIYIQYLVRKRHANMFPSLRLCPKTRW